MDRRELADLLDRLCERPLGEEPLEISPAAAERLAEVLEGAEAESAELEPEALADVLAAILSGTATQAQCQAFRAAAITSAAVRAEALSALAFVEAVGAAPSVTPAYLLEEVLRGADASTGERSGMWSRLVPAPGFSRAWRAPLAAVFTVIIAVLGVGLSWPLVKAPGPETSGVPFMPVSASAPTAAPASEAGRPAPAALDVAPAFAPIEPPQPAPHLDAKRSVIVETTAEAAPDPCASPRSFAVAAAQSRVAKPTASPPPRTAAAALPSAGCADRSARSAGAPVFADRPATLSNRRFDLDPFKGSPEPDAVPPMTYAPASPAGH